MRATANAMKSARRQRRALSLPEQLLWRILKQTRDHIRFRKQHAVGPYVADFYCPAAKLVIEIDGAAHDFRSERDARRDEYMRTLGRRVIRVPAKEVLADPARVADALLRLVEPASGPSTTHPDG